jgi:hypothetical protein
LSGDPAMVLDWGAGDATRGFFSNWDATPYFGSPSRACGIGVDNFSIRFTRAINIIKPGVHSFSTDADDWIRLYIDGQLRIEGSNRIDVYLTEGNHELRFEYFEYGGGAYLNLRLALASGPECTANVPTDRWKGEYFTNPILTNSPRIVRDDGAGFLNFNFGFGFPTTTCGFNKEPTGFGVISSYYDNFSIRWTRTVNFPAGTYRFTTTVDDGVRLYINGQLRIDRWFVQSATTYIADVFLPAGNHEVKMEYFDYLDSATAQLSWVMISP